MGQVTLYGKSPNAGYKSEHIILSQITNALLYGLPKYKIQRLQYVFNSKYSPVPMELHWLPVEQREEFKILLFTYKMVNGIGPVYLQDLVDLYRPCRGLRSGNMQLLKTQSYYLKSYGFRAFSICAPQLWNALPRELRVCVSVGSFKKAMNTFLFKKGYFLVKLRQTFIQYVRNWSQDFEILFKLYFIFLRQFSFFY